MRSELLNAGSAKLCFHHELKVGSVFERQIYSTDTKKKVKGGHKVTFEIAKMLDVKDIQSMPGFQLCRSYFEEAQTYCHDVSEVEDYDTTIASDSYSSEAEDPFEKHQKIDLGDSLQSISISRIKTDSMPKHVKVSYAREKVGKAMSTLKQSFATAIGIEDLCKTENTKLSDKQKENKKKAKDLDDLMLQIKDNLPSFDYGTKIQILTLKPEILLQNFSDFLNT